MSVIRIFCIFIIAMICFAANPALAHSPLSASGAEQISAYLSLALLGLFWLIYLIGCRKKSPGILRSVYFHAALFLCCIAVLGPLDEWAETNEAAHMTQHMLLMVAVAPIWVFSQPLPQLIAGGGRIAVLISKPLISLTGHPMITAYLHGGIIWFWHLPFFYVLALENPWWHVLEHACFLVTAGFFWWSVLKCSHRQAPWALLAVLLTLMHTGFLGALLTFAPEPLYGAERHLDSQQLAGLIMWVAGGIPYITAAVWIGYRWYLQLMRRMV